MIQRYFRLVEPGLQTTHWNVQDDFPNTPVSQKIQEDSTGFSSDRVQEGVSDIVQLANNEEIDGTVFCQYILEMGWREPVTP